MSRMTSDRTHYLLVFACLALAGTLRFFDLDRANVWGDEAVSYRVASSPGPSAMLETLAAKDATRAPLHPLILQGWFRVFGTSLPSGRALSAAFGLAAVAMVYALGRQVFDRKTALIACGLAALNPLDIHHSREIRMYEGLALAVCLAWSLLFAFREDSRWWKRAAYTVAMAAMCYLHPLGGLMVIALGVGALILRPELRLGWGGLVAIHVALGLMLAPWVARYFDHPPMEFPRVLTARVLLEWPEGFTGGNSEAAVVGVALLVLGVVAASRGSASASPLLGSGIDRGSAALLAWFLVPPLMVLAYTLTRHPIFGERRYLLYVGPAYLLLVARGLVALPRPAQAALLGAFLYFNVQALDRRVFTLDRPDLRGAARVAGREDPAAPIVVVGYNRRKLFECLKLYRAPGMTGPVYSLDTLKDELARPGSEPAPTAWIALERPKDKPQRPMPEELARLYSTERLIELPHLTLTYNRRIPGAPASPPPVALTPGRPTR